MTLRLAKIVMVFSLAAFAFIVTFDNITDYGSNFAFAPCPEHGHDVSRQ